MKLQFKHQKFQADAAKAVVDVFAGQPYLTPSYMIDNAAAHEPSVTLYEDDFIGYSNQKIVPELTDRLILKNINGIQRANQIKPSARLEGKFNLTIEMETGVGKTYTYIKTMYELNKHYGWSKFIVVVPSIAIREGVYKSFQVTQEHFTEEYGEKIHFFIYNSAQLSEIDHFAADSSINVMIINAQAFNARSKAARRIYMELDEFRSRRPIDIIAKTNPILIIDEPQSVEGKQTKENLKQFNPLLTLRYSATHKPDSIYNMVYRLDAVEAYNKKLVKKIAVKGISEYGSTAANSYVYLESINLSKAAPTATIQFEMKGAAGLRKVTRVATEGYNLYEKSGQLEEYRQGFVVTKIDGRDNSLEFINGVKLYVGDISGNVSENQIRRIQIRETILSHIQKERELFYKGIKVLSLFFIDEVAKYREYDVAGKPMNGIYAAMFEEEYKNIINNIQPQLGDDDYLKYLEQISAAETHAGYFSIDKKGKMIDSELKNKKEKTADDVDAYDLIMKNKELLLERNPQKSPVRFIFSHSALREGWDNPNVFQICTLKQASSEVRKRQEVGRGLRLCVNQAGERMDANILGSDVHRVNVLTIIASESYDSFAKGLQNEIAATVADRPRAVTPELFIGKVIKDNEGNEQVIDEDTGRAIHYDLIANRYIDKKGILTDKYYKDKKNSELKVAEEVASSAADVVKIIDTIYDSRSMQIEDARSNNIELEIDKNKLAMPEFKALWSRINAKSVYVVNFVTAELVEKAANALNEKLQVSKIYFKIETGAMNKIKSKEELVGGTAFVKQGSTIQEYNAVAANNIKYDLVGKLVAETGLTRKAVIQILQKIRADTFNQFKLNPEEFIVKAAAIINDEKAAAVIEHITYNATNNKYSTDIFTDTAIKGRLNVNAMKVKKHLYDHIVYDSANERKFASELDISSNVAVYVKLPDKFYISTPVGRYNPDWAIAFYEGTVKHIYFVAETKGSLDTLNFNHITPTEQAKINCARKHFQAISNGNVVYDVIDSYTSLLEKVMK